MHKNSVPLFFTPLKNNHAILQTLFAIELDQPPTQDLLLAAFNELKTIRTDLPRMQLQQGVSINVTFGANGPQQSQAMGPVTGITFEAFSKNGELEKQLQINNNHILFTLFNYNGWKTAQEEAVKYLSEALIFFSKRCKIISFVLEYVDKFVKCTDTDTNSISLDDLLNNKSPYFPLNALKCSTLWHSHHGFFEEFKDTDNSKHLNNININVHEVSNGIIHLDIVCNHKSILTKQISNEDDFTVALNENLTKLHDKHKTIIQDTLSEKACSLIGITN